MTGKRQAYERSCLFCLHAKIEKLDSKTFVRIRKVLAQKRREKGKALEAKPNGMSSGLLAGFRWQ